MNRMGCRVFRELPARSINAEDEINEFLSKCDESFEFLSATQTQDNYGYLVITIFYKTKMAS